ncbi:hypothetical protein BRC64_02545, partial [Halobacteriales archaeon QH_10_67_22]
DGTDDLVYEADTRIEPVKPDDDCDLTTGETIDTVVRCDVTWDPDVDVTTDGIVFGKVDSYGNSTGIDHGTVYGTVDAESDVDLDTATVKDDVTAGNDVTITDESSIEGNITTGPSGTINIDSDSTVEGTLSAGDDVGLDSVTVTGNVEGPDVDIDSSTVDGEVLGTSSVNLDGATITGDVYVDSSDFSCSDSTINGEDCSEYTGPKDPSTY